MVGFWYRYDICFKDVIFRFKVMIEFPNLYVTWVSCILSFFTLISLFGLLVGLFVWISVTLFVSIF